RGRAACPEQARLGRVACRGRPRRGIRPDPGLWRPGCGSSRNVASRRDNWSRAVNTPRLAVLLGTHRSAQSLIPGLKQSRFVLTHHCLESAQLHEAIDGGAVDVALVSTGPRGLDAAVLTALSRRHVPLVVLDSH